MTGNVPMGTRNPTLHNTRLFYLVS